MRIRREGQNIAVTSIASRLPPGHPNDACLWGDHTAHHTPPNLFPSKISININPKALEKEKVADHPSVRGS